MTDEIKVGSRVKNDKFGNGTATRVHSWIVKFDKYEFHKSHFPDELTLIPNTVLVELSVADAVNLAGWARDIGKDKVSIACKKALDERKGK
jgi:hypothetical protein